MKYFYDTEFLEGKQKRPLILRGRLGNWMIRYPKPTIDLISIGIVAEDGREYYAVSKDFNLKEAWNRYDYVKFEDTDHFDKVYWIRENVLRPIFNQWVGKDIDSCYYDSLFTYENFKSFLRKHGKSNEVIAEEIKKFVLDQPIGVVKGGATTELTKQSLKNIKQGYVDIELYGYYSAYDHVVFCWIFGKMIDLPKGFPMYTIDLKQMLDEKANAKGWYYGRDIWSNTSDGKRSLQEKDFPASLEDKIKKIKTHSDYPKQEYEHHALADARWNKKFYNFLQNL